MKLMPMPFWQVLCAANWVNGKRSGSLQYGAMLSNVGGKISLC